MTLRLVDGRPILRPCPACRGIGFTRLAAFVAGLGNLLGSLVGEPVDPWACKRCRGLGRVHPTEDQP